MCSKSQVTLKNNIGENATNNRLYQVASIDASFIFTSSAMAALIRPALSETFFSELHNIYLFYVRSVFVYWNVCTINNSSLLNLSWYYACPKGYRNNSKNFLQNCGFWGFDTSIYWDYHTYFYIRHHVVANMYCRINRRCCCHSYIRIWLQQVPPKRRYLSTNLHGVMSQGTEIFVVKCTKFSWYKTAGQIMLPHQSQHGRCYLFKALLIISSETLNKTKKNLIIL